MRTLSEFGYYLTYRAEECFDDGGPVHDVFWKTYRVHLWEAKTDGEARKLAKEMMKRTYPCNGGMCSNKGRKKFISLDHSVTLVSRREMTL